MLDDWLGELAFVHYWRVLEERGSGVTKAPEFTHLSTAERQAWVEAAKAIGEQVCGNPWLASSLDTHDRLQDAVSPILFNAQGDKGLHARRASRRYVACLHSRQAKPQR